MKSKLTLIAFLTFFYFSSFGQNGKEFPVETILEEIQLGLVQIQTKLKNNSLPPLQSVELTLETYYKKSSGGQFKLLIFSIGKKWEKETSQQLRLTLKPPVAVEAARIANKKTLSGNLIDLVVSAAKGVQKAKNNEEFPLETVALEAQLKFTILTVTKNGLGWEIVPISSAVSGTRDLKKTAIHTMKVTFAKD